MVVPGNLIEQFCGELRKFAPDLKILIYHGDSRAKRRAGNKVINDTLTTSSAIFSGEEAIKNTVVMTTISTLDSRHGPQVLKVWRLKQKDTTTKQAVELYNTPNFKCPALIPSRFDTVVVDEAHCLKRPDSSYSQVVQWLQPNFTLLATATPAMNSNNDWEGYLPFVQPRPGHAPGVATPGNPYLTDSQAPVSSILDPVKANEYIFSNRDQLQKGAFLRALQEQCSISRTYTTTINGEKVGNALPPLHKRRIDTSFSKAAQKLYKKWAAAPLRKLIRSEGSPPNNRIMWNQKNFRKLVLLATWLGFEAISDDVLSENLSTIKKDPSILQKWMMKVQKQRQAIGLEYDLPDDMNDRIALVQKICTEAPKVSIVLALLSDEVATLKENIVIWTLFPGVQIFYWVILKALGYDVEIVSSDMPAQERNAITTAFGQQKGQSKVLLLTYALSSFGLNLQGGCHIDIHADVAISQQITEQARARIRRFGQLLACISYALSVKNTFNDRQVSNVLSKAFGTAISSLNPTIFNVTAKENEDGDVQINLGDQFVEADGELTTAGSDEAKAATKVRPLDSEGVVNWILARSQGKSYETGLERNAGIESDSDEDEDEDDDVKMEGEAGAIPEGLEEYVNATEDDDLYGAGDAAAFGGGIVE